MDSTEQKTDTVFTKPTEIPSGTSRDDGNDLPKPSMVLYPSEKLDYSWKYPEGGVGLINSDNNCFLNAVMQCLIHTPPLTNYLLSGDHYAQCRIYDQDLCILCKMRKLAKRSLLGSADPFPPKWFINRLQFIGSHFTSGQQEDAHEFLRLTLEKMRKCLLVGANYNDKHIKETTVVNQIFGGFLRSQVICLKCRARSNTYDHVLDISLDLKNVESLEQAFATFVAPEKLDMDNAYNCEKCNQKVSALKRFNIHKAPNVLTIQLKRFVYTEAWDFEDGKITKFIKYPARLNLRPYMSNKHGPPEMYSLFASIQHEGFSCQSGHYVANVRCGQRWYHFNDTVKRRVSMQHCLSESSTYVLFYMKEESPPSVSPSRLCLKSQKDEEVKQNGATSSTASKTVSPEMSKVNETPEKPHTFTSLNVVETNGLKMRISLGNKPSQAQTSKNLLKRAKSEDIAPPGTPRLVMKIKDGKSTIIEMSPDGTRKILSDDDVVRDKMDKSRQRKFRKRSRLVTISNESSSEYDWSIEMSTAKTKDPGENQRDPSAFNQFLETLNLTPRKHAGEAERHPSEAMLCPSVGSHSSLNTKNFTSESDWSVSSSSKSQGKANDQGQKQKDLVVFDQFLETLNLAPSKHASRAELHTSEAILTPSVGSHSSLKTKNSTSDSDWSMSMSGKSHVTSSEYIHEGSVSRSSRSYVTSSDHSRKDWTVTPNIPDPERSKSAGDLSSKSNHKESGYIAQKKEHAGRSRSLTNVKRQVMLEQMRPDDILANLQSPTTSDKACLLDNSLSKDSLVPRPKSGLYKMQMKPKPQKRGHREHVPCRSMSEELSDEYENYRSSLSKDLSVPLPKSGLYMMQKIPKPQKRERLEHAPCRGMSEELSDEDEEFMNDIIANLQSPTPSNKASLLENILSRDLPVPHPKSGLYMMQKKHKPKKRGRREHAPCRGMSEGQSDEDEDCCRDRKRRKENHNRDSESSESSATDSYTDSDTDSYSSDYDNPRLARDRIIPHDDVRAAMRRHDMGNPDKSKPESSDSEDSTRKRKRTHSKSESDSSSESEWEEPTPCKKTKFAPVFSRKRRSDSEDEDFDRGKIKKRRLEHSASNSGSPGTSPEKNRIEGSKKRKTGPTKRLGKTAPSSSSTASPSPSCSSHCQ